MLKIIFCFFLFFHFYSQALSSKDSLRAEEDSIFDESDLIDIESGSDSDLNNEDSILEQEFNDIKNDQSENNFDPKDFEKIEQEEIPKEKYEITEDEIQKEDFSAIDYEIISDRPGYEILSDEELEKEFEAEPDFDNNEEGLEGLDGEDFDNPEEDLDELESDQKVLEDMESLEDDTLTDSEDSDTADFEELESDQKALEGMDNLEDDTLTDNEDSDVADFGELESDQKALEGMDNLEDGTLTDSEDSDVADFGELESDQKALEGMDNLEDDTLTDSEDSDVADFGELESDLDEKEDDLREEDLEETDFGNESFSEDSIEEESFDGTAETEALNLITNIRYLTMTDQIVIDTSEIPTYEERINEKTNQIIIEIAQAKLAKNLNWPYILRDFKTDFGLLKADQKDSTTVRVIIQLKTEAPIPPVTLDEEDRIVIGEAKQRGQENTENHLNISSEILPQKTLKDLYFGDIEFVGDPISFHVIDADVRQVLRFISEESGINMVIDETVKGTVTLKLEDIPWDQALFTIFKVHSLGYVRDDNIITILPLKKIEEQTKQLKDIADKQKSLAPIQTKVLPIMHKKATDIEAKVKEYITPKTDLAPGGKIIVHEDSNSLIVIDNAEAIKKIEDLTKFLDYPTQQVLVESKIVEVTKDFTKNFGLDWNLSGDLPVRIGANGLLDFFQTAFNNFGASWTTSNNATRTSFNLNGLPFVGNVSARLSLAENEGTARVLNTTKILIESGKSASISRNSPMTIPGGEPGGEGGGDANEGGGTTVVNNNQITYTQEDVTLSTQVTPTVTSSGSIAMQVNVTLENPGRSPGQVGETTKISRTASTEVVSKSGQTLVLSGISQKAESQSNDGFPFFKNIPFLGFLFRNSESSSVETEMLMFITPTLIEK